MKTNRLISLLLCLCMVFALFTGFAESASAADEYISYTIKNGDNLYTLVGKMGMNYGTVKYVIMALNGFTNENQLSQLQPGQTILLPTSNQAAASLASKAINSTAATTTVAVATTGTGTTGTAASTASASAATSSTSSYQGFTPAYYLVAHTVQKNETFITICKALGTNYYDYVSVVLGVNSMTNANNLKVGQSVWVPAKTGSAGGTIAVVAYSVKPGDSISSICNEFGTSYANYKAVVKAVNPKIKNVEKLTVGQTVYIPVYTTWNNAVAGNNSTAAGNEGAPSITQATGYSISFTATDSAKYGAPFAIVGTQANVARAQAGSTVIIRPNAYSGYAVTGVKVVRTDSNAHIQVNDFAFTMPNSNVQITIDYAAGKQIRKLNSPHGHFDTYVYGSAADSAFYGDEVEIVPYPDEGYEVESVLVFDATSASTDPADALFSVSKDTKTNSFHFTMPNQHAKVKVTFGKSTTVKLRYNIATSLYSGEFGGMGVVKFFVNGQEVTEANPGDKVTAVVIPADGWIIETEPLFAGDVSGPVTLQAKKVAEYTYTFTIPVTPKNMLVVAYIRFVERVPYYLLSVNLTGKGSPGMISFTVTDAISGQVRKFAEYAFPGDKVEIVPYVTSGIRWDETKPGKAQIYDTIYSPTETKNYTTIAITGALLDNSYWVKDGYEFIMPAAGVNVEARFNAPAYDSSTGVVTYDPSSYAETEAAYDTYLKKKMYLVSGATSEYGTIEIYDKDPNPATNPSGYKTAKTVGSAAPGTDLWMKITPITNYRIMRDYDGSTGKPYQYYIYYSNYSVTDFVSQITDLGAIKEDPNTSIIYAKFKMPQNDCQAMAYFEKFYRNETATGYDTVTIKAFNVDYGTPYAVTATDAGTKIISDSVGNYNVQMWINGIHVPDASQAVAGNIVILRFEVKDDRKLEKVVLVKSNGEIEELLPNGDGYYWYLIKDTDVNAKPDYTVDKEPLQFMVFTSEKEKPVYTISHGGTFDSTHMVDLAAQLGAKYYIENLTTGDYADNFGLVNASEGDEIIIAIPSLADKGYGLDQVNVKGIDNFTMGDLTWDAGGYWYYTFYMPPTNLTTEVLYKEYQNTLAEQMNP